VAEDGARGFELARSWRPDAIILDIVMPVMDGLELLLKLRSDLAPPIPPVILCSGFDLTKEEALRRGASRFLRKPIEIADLIEAVDDVLSGRGSPAHSERRQREHASAARATARAIARALVARVTGHGEAALARLRKMAQAKISTLAAYVGVSRGAMAVIDGDGLVVLAATESCGLPAGYDLGSALPEAYEVIETASSLLLPDASMHPFGAVARALGGVRLFIGVPMLVEGRVPVGIVCLFDAAARRIDTEDLRVMQLVGQRGSDVLVNFAELGDASRVIPYGHGVSGSEIFHELLDAELCTLDRQGGSMELAVVDVRDLDGVSAAIAHAQHPERLVAGVLAPRRVAIFKRACDDSAGAQISAILDELRRTESVEAAGVVDLRGRGVSGLAARELVDVASIALDRVAQRGGGRHCILIEARPQTEAH
jgi:CheY-like chemotaxis protein